MASASLRWLRSEHGALIIIIITMITIMNKNTSIEYCVAQ